MISNEEFINNLDRINKMESTYPFKCKTKSTRYPDANEVKSKLLVDHLRVPLLDNTVWMFKFLEDLKLFKTRYVTIDNKNQ